MAAKLPYKVECKSSYPFFETIAAFDCESPALAYAADCAATAKNRNLSFEYRVTKRGKVVVNEWDAL